MEELVKEYGFESLEEFNNMVANVDFTIEGNYTKFKLWQGQDGSKKGLSKLLEA